jgi:hypothetical protein
MFTSDLEIGKLFTLSPSTAEWVPDGQIQALYYIRTFSVTVAQLKQIVEEWELHYRYYDEAREWIYQIKLRPGLGDDVPCYIRYVRMSQEREDGVTATAY